MRPSRPQHVLVLDRKEQRRNIRHTSCSLYSAVSEDMPWLCKRTPQHAIADLHMLAAGIVSTCPSHIPRCPVSSLVIVWSRQSFISSASGSVGLGQIWGWAALSGSLRTDYYFNITAFLVQETTAVYGKQTKDPLVKKSCLDKSCSFVEEQGLDLFTKRSNNDSFYSVQGLIALLHPPLIWPCETSAPSRPTAIHQFHWNSKTPVLAKLHTSGYSVGTCWQDTGRCVSGKHMRLPGQTMFMFVLAYRQDYSHGRIHR